MNIRPSDIPVLRKALQSLIAATIDQFPGASPQQLSQKQNTAKGLVVKLSMRTVGFTQQDVAVLLLACVYGSSVSKEFTPLESRILSDYQKQFELLLYR